MIAPGNNRATVSRPRPRFPLGSLYATPGALQAMEAARQTPADFLTRHQAGDWGGVCLEDKQANDKAVERGERILSAYTLKTGVRIWLITEADRAATTVLLPDEY